MEKKYFALIVTVTITTILGFTLTALFAASGVTPGVAVLYTISVAALFSGIILGALMLSKVLLKSVIRLADEDNEKPQSEVKPEPAKETAEPTKKAEPAKAKKPVAKKPAAKPEKKAEPEKKAPAKKTKKASAKKSSK